MGFYLFFVLSVCFWAQSAVSQCPRDGDGFGFYAHPQQCDAYYECVNGTATEVKCPDGLVFNERRSIKSARCDYPAEVDCTDRPVLQQARPTSKCPRRWGLFAHENDCGRFWNCVDGTPYAFQCPEGLAFNDESNHCDWPDQVDRCSSETMLEFQCPEPGPGYASKYDLNVYAHINDCRKHYVCVYGADNQLHPRLLACQEGQVFNIETSQCDKPINVPGCENYYGALEADGLGAGANAL